jgi:hypothetical protein
MVCIGYKLQCQWCNEDFGVCVGCYCGQRYCSSDCSDLARRKSCREAQRRYAATSEGKENKRKLQRQYRIRKSRNQLKKRVTDQSSDLNAEGLTKGEGNTKRICLQCRRLILGFVNRVGRTDATPRDSV